KNAVLQGFSLKNCKSLVQNRAPGYAGNVSAQSISFGTGSPFTDISNRLSKARLWNFLWYCENY
ncbi:MAG: hypothetical protein LBS37_01305, partial [Treponema sp.]|nr:hypothetical protein [Treponema sp.]